MTEQGAFQLLNLVLLAAERGIPLIAPAKEIRRKVGQMEEENRDPNSEEWNAIIAMLGGDAEDTIEDAAARARQHANDRLAD